MSSYSIDSDSPRWWWRSATVGAVGAAAIAAILILPANGSLSLGETTPQDIPAPVSDPWFATVDPAVGRQCFMLPARVAGSLDQPRCGRRPVIEPWSGIDVRRPGLDARP